jgi:proton glutamate symport protein
MDMARTTVNLIGNCLASCVMARWEGEFDDDATGVLPGDAPVDANEASATVANEKQSNADEADLADSR